MRRPRAHRTGAAAAAVLLLAGGLTGCSMLDDGDSSSGSASGSSGEAVAGGEAAVDTTTADPIVQATLGAPPQAPQVKVEIAIMKLKVRGKLATLTVQMTPRLPGDGSATADPFDLNGRNLLQPALIDPVNLKRYIVVEDSRGHKMETDSTIDLADDKAGTLRYTFAAPPENVRTVDVQIGSWPPFHNIPVER